MKGTRVTTGDADIVLGSPTVIRGGPTARRHSAELTTFTDVQRGRLSDAITHTHTLPLSRGSASAVWCQHWRFRASCCSAKTSQLFSETDRQTDTVTLRVDNYGRKWTVGGRVDRLTGFVYNCTNRHLENNQRQ